MPLKKCLLLLFCALSLTTVKAQLYTNWYNRQIATDYNTCMQGVKDTLGNWVIEPKYEFIRSEFNYYVVSSAGRYGLVDKDGKEMIPMMYQSIYSVYSWSWSTRALRGYYIVQLNDQMGIVDSVNHVIVPAKYDRVHGTPDSNFIAGKGKTWEFYNLKGEHFVAPWKSKAEPWRIAPHTYAMRARKLTGKKWGIINDSGEVVLKRKYTRVNGYEQTGMIQVSDHKKYGFCSLAGKMIWPIRFSFTRNSSLTYNFAYQYVGYYGTGPAILNGRYGLINYKGDTLLPFQYDYIAPFNEYDENELWVVEVNNQSGIYDTDKGWIIQPELNSLITVTSFVTEKDSSTIGLLIAQRNKQWGAMTTQGQIVIPFSCSYMLRINESDFIFQKGDSLFELTFFSGYEHQLFVRTATRSVDPFFVSWEAGPIDLPAPVTGQLSEYQGKDGARAFYNPAHTHDSIYGKDTAYCLDKGEYNGTVFPDSIFLSTLFYVKPIIRAIHASPFCSMYATGSFITDDTLPLTPDFVRLGSRLETISNVIAQEHGSTYYITSGNTLLKEDGKIIISGDTSLYITDRHHGADGSLFFTTCRSYGKGEAAVDTNGRMQVPYSNDEIADYTADYCWYAHGYNTKYILVNLHTKEKLLGRKTFADAGHPIWDSITIVEDEKHGMRLFNIPRKKYCTSIGFGEIETLDLSGQLFAVKTCSGRIGIMRSNGQWVQDTLYFSMTPVDYDTSIFGSDDFEGPIYQAFYRHIVLYNREKAVMLDLQTGEVLSQTQATQLAWNKCLVPERVPDIQLALRDSFLSFWQYRNNISFYVSEQDTAGFLPWHRQCIIDSLYAPRRSLEDEYDYYNYPCEYCQNRGASSFPFRWCQNYARDGHFLMEHKSDSMLSFFRFEHTYDIFSWGFERNSFSNVMLFPDGAHQLTLDSLFAPTSDWRNFIVNTVITYVNTHLNVYGDCHNPAAIPIMLSQSFLISPAGLELYPKGFTENGQQLVITVPWKDADSYLRNDIRSRLPINPPKK